MCTKKPRKLCAEFTWYMSKTLINNLLTPPPRYRRARQKSDYRLDYCAFLTDSFAKVILFI